MTEANENKPISMTQLWYKVTVVPGLNNVSRQHTVLNAGVFMHHCCENANYTL